MSAPRSTERARIGQYALSRNFCAGSVVTAGMKRYRTALVVIGLLVSAAGCDWTPDRGSNGSAEAETSAVAVTITNSTELPNVCAVASVELLRLWYGWDVELVATTDATCTFSGLPMGDLTVASSAGQGVTVRASDGFTDPLFGDFLVARALATTESVTREVDARVAAMSNVGADHQVRCGYLLTVGSGEVMVSALPSSDQAGSRWPPYGHARISFGHGLPGDVCSDVADEKSPASVDAEWPLSFDRLEFQMVQTLGACGDATLVLHGASAIAPDGRTVALPDPLETRNTGFGVFPPHECYLD